MLECPTPTTLVTSVVSKEMSNRWKIPNLTFARDRIRPFAFSERYKRWLFNHKRDVQASSSCGSNASSVSVARIGVRVKGSSII
jgi:hypothetical protein